jgi:hypothetical protein
MTTLIGFPEHALLIVEEGLRDQQAVGVRMPAGQVTVIASWKPPAAAKPRNPRMIRGGRRFSAACR